MRSFLIANGEVVTAAIPEDLTDAISMWLGENRDSLNAVIAPFGGTMDDLLQPEWRQTLRADGTVAIGTSRRAGE